MNISGTQQESPIPAILRLGFRPFFLMAGLSSVILMLVWFFVYQSSVTIPHTGGTYWHAHEMIFGYTIAVIVGFVLTAAKNWTGVQTLYGKALGGLVLLWLAARFLPLIAADFLVYQALADTSFLFLAVMAIYYSIHKTKKWQHIGIVVKIFLMGVANVIFYLGLLEIVPNGQQIGLYLGFYLVLSLVLMMARRLLPFFIERGVEADNVTLRNSKFLDLSSLVLFLIFLVVEVFFTSPASYVLSGLLFVIHSTRLVFWYHKGIWQRPLLWSLYVAYFFLVVGFLLKTLSFFVVILPHLDIHSWAFGLGLLTLSMMSRVSLGHTGRNIFSPPKTVNYSFILLALGFVARIVMPMLAPSYYVLWIGLAQLLWAGGFLLFVVVYAPMFLKPRVDGEFG